MGTQETLEEGVAYDARAADLFACGAWLPAAQIWTCIHKLAKPRHIPHGLLALCVVSEHEVVGYALAIGNYPWQSTAGGRILVCRGSEVWTNGLAEVLLYASDMWLVHVELLLHGLRAPTFSKTLVRAGRLQGLLLRTEEWPCAIL